MTSKICLIITLLTISIPSMAQEDFFGENYLSFETVRNQPYSSSQKQFITGDTSVFVGFRHILSDDWLMGVHGGFKHFEAKQDNESLNIFTVLQESKYLIRLYHPIYFAFGPRLLYLLPTQGRKIPPEQEKRFKREIGAAISLDLILRLDKQLLLTFRLDRWRGLNRETFQSTETAMGLNYRLP